MGYQVLARKYRPQRFSDVYGQDHVTRTLTNALTQNRIAHGYIFSGHRGIGKTTIARILAMALDCRTEVGTALRPTVEPCLQCVSCKDVRRHALLIMPVEQLPTSSRHTGEVQSCHFSPWASSSVPSSVPL